ncbi:MAG: DUF6600 domain-containing protein [Pseudomonadota bacterium]
MPTPFLKTLVALALAAVSALALADPPARVGRIALVQGAVSVSGEVGQEASAALVNWPITSHNQVTTGRDGRTELRVGSTAIRLDADSSLDISELDDESLRLHLHYGSVSVRLRSDDALRGFELSTPQGHVRLQEPGRVRIDAERTRDTSVINVFDGVALVDGGGSTLTVRAGKRAEIRNDDVLTGLAVRDSFDDWAAQRDARDERVTSDRYVTRDMTGYEELDQNGSWRDDAEYGPLWTPVGVGADWAPYRDGRWAWVAPWGWTWVDNAPWGYAPFHYGRWVMVNQRWCWAPGRQVGVPVWSPALVGWVGGGGWSVSFNSGGSQRQMPAQGWYPLGPREVFVPGYRVSQERLHYINRHAREGADRDGRHEGLTVVPHEQFGQRGVVQVNRVPHAALAPQQVLRDVKPGAPPPPLGARRDRDGEPRFDNRANRNDNRPGMDNRERRGNEQRPAPAVVLTAPPAVQAVAPAAAPAAVPRRDQRPGFDEGRRIPDEGRRDARPVPVAPPAVQAVAPPRPAAEPLAQPRIEHGNRQDGERRQREAEPPMARPAPPVQAVQPVRTVPAQAEKAASSEPAKQRHNEERGNNNRGERDNVDKR